MQSLEGIQKLESAVQRVEIVKGCTGLNSHLLDSFFRVIDISTAAALEAVGAWIAFRGSLNSGFCLFGNRRLVRCRRLFGRLKLVAHRSVAMRDDSIRVNSWQ